MSDTPWTTEQMEAVLQPGVTMQLVRVGSTALPVGKPVFVEEQFLPGGVRSQTGAVSNTCPLDMWVQVGPDSYVYYDKPHPSG